MTRQKARSKRRHPWRDPALPRAQRIALRREARKARRAGLDPRPGGRPHKGKPTPKTTSLSRGQSPRNWARLLRRHGPAV